MGLFDAFSASDEQAMADKGYARYEKQAKKSIKGYQQAGQQGQGFLDQGIAAQQPLMDRGNPGMDWYGNLLGINGGDPQARQQFLEGTPGYQFALDQGIEGLNRGANARGMLQSGNNSQDIMRFASGLASQNYFNLLNAGQPYFGLGQGAAGNIQQGYTNKANFGRGIAQDIGGARQNLGQMGYQNMADRAAAQGTAEKNMWDSILGGANAAAKAYAGGA